MIVKYQGALWVVTVSKAVHTGSAALANKKERNRKTATSLVGIDTVSLAVVALLF